MLKRAFDLTAASFGVLALSPVFVLIAILVKLDSRGPIFYRGRRTGRHGRMFRIYKFRSMRPDAEKVGGPSTGKEDFRVTRLGRFLRRYKMDELPQLFNVIAGDMSVVGPRPEVPEYTELYEGEERLILTVRPGLTDYASLRFFRLDEVLGSNDPDEVYETQVRPVKNALRVKYVREQSFRKDMLIILRTCMKLVGGV